MMQARKMQVRCVSVRRRQPNGPTEFVFEETTGAGPPSEIIGLVKADVGKVSDVIRE